MHYLVYSDNWTQADLNMLSMAFGPKTGHTTITQEQHIEWQVNSGQLDIHLNDLVGYDIDLLALPINARAATYYSINTDPQAFVANLVQVDVSTILASDMRCPHCWSNFDEAEDEMIELKNGSVQTDNSPVKMPCPHGHLIGKTCLMQIVDAGDRLCPQCRSEIVRIVDPRQYHPAVRYHAFKEKAVKYSDWN
jgi:Zn finger protein HypA/HybF involved in hydrogenase expression